METTKGRYRVEWPGPDGLLAAFEPTVREVTLAADELARFYNNDHNSAMMAHAAAMSSAEVAEHFANLRSGGGRAFLLERQGTLMGDADLRHIAHRAAEFAIMVGHRQEQGRGLGTRFALMLHALAFRGLELEQLYVTIIPANRASQGLFRKLGYDPDNSPAARAYIDEEDDITMSMSRDKFERLHAATLIDVRVAKPAGT
jgi:RimJ/RimL family protein N-acetyltransferase